jgi:hypothetical protein
MRERGRACARVLLDEKKRAWYNIVTRKEEDGYETAKPV